MFLALERNRDFQTAFLPSLHEKADDAQRKLCDPKTLGQELEKARDLWVSLCALRDMIPNTIRSLRAQIAQQTEDEEKKRIGKDSRSQL
jgi:hypothetical protein